MPNRRNAHLAVATTLLALTLPSCAKPRNWRARDSAPRPVRAADPRREATDAESAELSRFLQERYAKSIERACAESALSSEPLPEELRLRLTVSADGRILHVSCTDQSRDRLALAGRLRHQVLAWKLPPNAGQRKLYVVRLEPAAIIQQYFHLPEAGPAPATTKPRPGPNGPPEKQAE